MDPIVVKRLKYEARVLFRFAIEKTFTCVICNNQYTIEEVMDEITVTSSKYNKTNEMINEYWTSTITKQCIQCKIDTSHSEQIKIINHPRVFTVIILRFDNNMEKIGTPINIKKSIVLFGKKTESSRNHKSSWQQRSEWALYCNNVLQLLVAC